MKTDTKFEKLCSMHDVGSGGGGVNVKTETCTAADHFADDELFYSREK